MTWGVRAAALAAMALGATVSVWAQSPPSGGRLLLAWCSAADPATPNPVEGPSAAIAANVAASNRVACLQTIRATVALQQAQNAETIDWNAHAGSVMPGTSGPRLPRSLPGPFCLVFRGEVYSVTDALYDARRLVRFLRRQPPEVLDPQGPSDDAMTRLLLAYLAESYPCGTGRLTVFDREARR
jgi:hypothetical protein